MTVVLPEPIDPFLIAVTMAIGRRTKSLKHSASAWELSLSDADGEERLDFDVTELRRRMRLSVWSDRQFFLQSCKPVPGANKGWEWVKQFYGRANDASELVDRFRKWWGLDHDSEATKQHWSRFDLVVAPSN